MKKTGLLSLFLFLGLMLNAQNDEFQTIGGNGGKIRVSGFAGPVMQFSKIGDDFALLMGGGGAVIINNFFLGGYGVGKTTELEYRDEPANLMTYGHGGFWMGYTFWHNKAIHPVLHTQIGWGKIGKRPKDLDVEYDSKIGDKIFVVCPTLEIEMNFSRFFKVGTGINYSLVYNTNEAYSPYTAVDFSNIGVFVSLKFGWFR